MSCPDAETLGRWLSGEVDADERAAIADHAAECATCHAVIDAWCPPTADAHDATMVATEQPTAAPGELAIGARVDRYRILRRIGGGGMGVVYAARDDELGRDVAIKLVRPGASTERFAREAQALARLSHPNVVAVHDVGAHDGRTFIAMALVDGVDLRRWLTSTRSIEEILGVIRGAGAGIAAAHKAGLVHRDLKPDNIFVARDGHALVGDFGLARELASDEVDAPPSGDALALSTPLTGTGTVLGTPAYMAPEQAKGEATEASDQFSLCVTAWEALFGARPFAGATLRQILERIKAGRITRVPEAKVPARIEKSLRRGLAADPDARFTSVDELMRALAPRRARWPWIAGAAAIALAITAIVASRGGGVKRTACDDAASLDGIWDPSIRSAIAKIDPKVPTADVLDAYATRWRRSRIGVCEAAARGEQTAETAERKVACLDERKAELARAARGAAQDPPLDAWRAAESLADVDACARASAAAPDRAKAKDIDDTLAALAELNMRRVATTKTSPAEAVALRQHAESIGFPPLVADALSMEALFAIDAGDYATAEAILRRAVRISEEARYDLGRARASGSLAIALADLGRMPEAKAALEEADGALVRAGGDADLDLELADIRAKVAAIGGDPAAAAAILERRLDALRQRDGADSIVVAYAEIDLAIQYTGANQELKAADRIRDAQAIIARHGGSGVDAPETLGFESSRALQTGDFARSIDLAARSVIAARAAHYDDNALAVLMLGLAQSYDVAGKWPQAASSYADTIAVLERVPEAARNLELYEQAQQGLGASLLQEGKAADAIAPLEHAIAIEEKMGARGDDDRGIARSMLGRALVELGKMREARELLEPTLRDLRTAQPLRPQRTGTAAFALAQALWEDGDAHDRARALTLAGDAERDLDQAITQAADRPVMVVALRILDQRRKDLVAWRERHKQQ
ncbi:MAG TPA: protein kinase [Kofleriaceae bacterium]|nr:protein kinase [Kofleriaceae bacterium]